MLAHSEGGYTLVELLTTMAILGVVLAGLTTAFMSGTKAEIDMNKRFQAQINARLAIQRLRRDVHCAQAVDPATASEITLHLPTAAGQCKSGQGLVTWCTRPSGSQFTLHRSTAPPCDTADRLFSEHLTSGSVFTYYVQSSERLGSVAVDVSVDAKPADPIPPFVLRDELVLRNTTRTCITGSPSPC